MGPIITTSSSYWLSHSPYRYLGNLFIYPGSQHLIGVFDANIYPSVINASLWTLCYEFSCYAGLAAIGLIIRKAWKSAILMAAFTFVSVFYTYISPPIFIKFSSYFFVGGFFYLMRKHIVLDSRLFLISVVALVSTLMLKAGFHAVFPIFGAYLIIHLAHSNRLQIDGFSRFGDFSYGVYIYAFPIQQLLAPYTASAIANFLYSMPIILLCAIGSWHFVEKPILSRKRSIATFIRTWSVRRTGRVHGSETTPPSGGA
jgi:peptidoglycan/LPS O-acetylase OafA/YrhL